jgi:hypothetical protein
VIKEDRHAEVGGSGEGGRAEERNNGEQEEEKLFHGGITSQGDKDQ